MTPEPDFDHLCILAARAQTAVTELQEALAHIGPTSGRKASARQARYEKVRDDYLSGYPITEIQRRNGISRKTVFDILDRFPDVERRNDRKAREADEADYHYYATLAHRSYPQRTLSAAEVAEARRFGIDLTPKTAPDGTEPVLDAQRVADERAQTEAFYDQRFADPKSLADLRKRAAAGTLRQGWLNHAAKRGIDLLSDGSDDLF